MFEKVYPFDIAAFSGESFHFVVIGCGGNGAFLVPQLARQVSVMNANGAKHKITLIDKDVVEEKNLIRQNFIMADLNENKASILAGRYSSSFGIPIQVFPDYVEDEDKLINIIRQEPGYPVILGCVDNNKTRQMVANIFKKRQQMFWIDSGNEEYHGQVICGWNGGGAPDYAINGAQLFYLPCVIDVFPDIMNDKETKFITEMSCAEHAVSHPQSIATNITASTLMFMYCNMLLNAREIAQLKVNGHTFDSRGIIRPLKNTKEQLALRYTEPQTVEEEKPTVPLETLRKKTRKKVATK